MNREETALLCTSWSLRRQEYSEILESQGVVVNLMHWSFFFEIISRVSLIHTRGLGSQIGLTVAEKCRILTNLAEASFSCSVNYFVIHSSSSYSPTPNPTSDLLHGMLHGKARALSRSPPCSSKNTKKLPFVSILSSFFHVATCSLPTLVSHARARARATSQNLSQFSLYRYKSVQYMESH